MVTPPAVGPDNNVPADTLVCDLHYEQSWELRRRFTIGCSAITKFTLPCTGTYACFCRHGSSKEYFRVSKTLPVLPSTYSGLTIEGMNKVWTEEVEESTDDDEDDTTTTIIIVIVASVLSTLVLCCVCYYVFICCAKKRHKVSYENRLPSTGTKDRSSQRQVSSAKRRRQDDGFASGGGTGPEDGNEAANTGSNFVPATQV